ncbi:MAG: DUF922 domain-containing Zn-dependent protease [Phyllobacterium sp.]
MKRTRIAALATLACLMAAPSAEAANVFRTYKHYTITGKSAEDLDRELIRRGPLLKSSGQRHPGATEMRFDTKVKYGQDGKYCRVASATVNVHATVHLPRWKQRKTAKVDLALIWDTLSRDIKRHEESHISIARTHALEMERAVMAIHPKRDCDKLKAEIDKNFASIMKKHDAAQAQFDLVETINFESRFERLLTYRLLQEIEKK